MHNLKPQTSFESEELHMVPKATFYIGLAPYTTDKLRLLEHFIADRTEQSHVHPEPEAAEDVGQPILHKKIVGKSGANSDSEADDLILSTVT
ncbi:hypothetical protein PMIN03_001631 [Paraphaeosphaeria minitans]